MLLWLQIKHIIDWGTILEYLMLSVLLSDVRWFPLGLVRGLISSGRVPADIRERAEAWDVRAHALIGLMSLLGHLRRWDLDDSIFLQNIFLIEGWLLRVDDLHLLRCCLSTDQFIIEVRDHHWWLAEWVVLLFFSVIVDIGKCCTEAGCTSSLCREWEIHLFVFFFSLKLA